MRIDITCDTLDWTRPLPLPLESAFCHLDECRLAVEHAPYMHVKDGVATIRLSFDDEPTTYKVTTRDGTLAARFREEIQRNVQRHAAQASAHVVGADLRLCAIRSR